MITLNFFTDGVYIKGHDIQEICTLISFAMCNCIEDCLEVDEDVYHYQSAYDDNWKHLGFTYIKVNESNSYHLKILNKFKNRISKWVEELFNDRVKIIISDKKIEWETALKNAKELQQK